jgi:DNA adenine methylase
MTQVALAERTKPIVKWAGGKSRLLPELIKRLPANIRELRYVEPFFGGGALFFALRPAGKGAKKPYLNDANKHLIATLKAVRDQLPAVLAELATLEEEHSLETFLTTRKLLSNPDLPAPTRAAAFLYLNRTAFNGLYRVNSKGEFNVPFGKYAKPRIRDVEGLTEASAALQRTVLKSVDFEQFVAGVGAGDFVYFDPPYVATSETSNFAAYTKDGFTDADQERLAETMRDLGGRGAYVMMSQSDQPLVHKLYKGFLIQKVWNSRSVSAKGNSRGQVQELIIRNYRR